MATRAPRMARARAVAAPMPCDAPVTSATMPSSVRGGHGCSSSPGDRAALAPGGTYPKPQCRMSSCLPCCCSCCCGGISGGHRGRFAAVAVAVESATRSVSVLAGSLGSRLGTRKAGTAEAKGSLLVAAADAIVVEDEGGTDVADAGAASGAGGGAAAKAQRGQPPPALAAHWAQTRWRQLAKATRVRTPRQQGHISCAAAAVLGPVGARPGVGKPPSRPWTGSPQEGHTLPHTRMHAKQQGWPQRSWRLAGAPHATHAVGDGVDSAEPVPDVAIARSQSLLVSLFDVSD